LTGTKHSFLQLSSEYLQGFLAQLREMVRLTDGMYLSHGLTEMLALGFLKSAPIGVLLRGHCGELAKSRLAWPLHTDDQVYKLQTRADLIEYLLERWSYVSGAVDWPSIFTPSWRPLMDHAARSSLEESLEDVDLRPSDWCVFLYLREHHRRFTVPSLELFRNAVEIRLPFADERFLAALLGGPTEWRDGTDLHRAIIASGNPALMRVRDSNTGAPIDAGPTRTLVTDKLNSVLKRLNVWGFRHYHDFDAWMERLLIESVEAELLGPRALDRGILDRERVRALVDGAKRGERGYAYLLQILLLLELWQQENIDARRES
jgi:asparagine synthase (glutamine-hydrolysing)